MGGQDRKLTGCRHLLRDGGPIKLSISWDPSLLELAAPRRDLKLGVPNNARGVFCALSAIGGQNSLRLLT